MGKWGDGEVGTWEMGKWGRGEVGNGEVGTWGRGDVGNGEVGTWGRGEAVSSPYHPKTLSPYLLPSRSLLIPHHCGLIIGAAGREGEGRGAGVGEAAGWGEVSLSLTK